MGAFVAADASLVRTEQTVLVESWEDKADITVTQVFKNTGNAAREVSFVLPTTRATGTPQVFLNAEGKTLEPLGLESAARTVFDLAAEFKTPAWLGSLDESFDAWWQLQNISIEPDKVVTLKYKYTQNLASFDSFDWGRVYLADGRESESLIVDLVRADEAVHWWSNLGVWESEKSNAAWAKRWQTQKAVLTENLNFFVSDKENPTLGYNYAGQGYQAKFEPVVSTDFARVALVLDNSGSVYGVRFERLKKAAKTLLESMPESTQIRVGLAGPGIEWLEDDWEKNTREQQKNTLAVFEGANAQGKTDWESVGNDLASLGKGADGRVALVWLGDFSDLPETVRTEVGGFGWKVLMVDFWQAESEGLRAWWQRFSAQYVTLFNSGYELVEADLLRAAWYHLGFAWPERQKLQNTTEDWRLPTLLKEAENQWNVGQVALLEQTSPVADFVPRWWAQRKLAAYLRHGLSRELKEEEVLAMLSIAHTFGVSILGVEGSATPETLLGSLKSVEAEALWESILQLESGAPATESSRVWKGQPHYQSERLGWQPLGWETYGARADRPELKTWSAAHKNLFLAEPQQLARPMSWGLATAFCAGARCASVTPNGREAVRITDNLLWSGGARKHWATSYWADLVWAEVIKEPQLDFDQWAQPVSRGQFVAWLVAYIEPGAILPAIDKQIFKDVEPDQLGAAEALWLKDKALFKGYDDGTANLDAPLKRIEALKLLMQARGLDIRDVLGNYDAQAPLTDLVGWTQPWGYGAYNRGLVKGYEDKTFRPFQALTEGEAFKLLVESERLLE